MARSLIFPVIGSTFRFFLFAWLLFMGAITVTNYHQPAGGLILAAVFSYWLWRDIKRASALSPSGKS